MAESKEKNGVQAGFRHMLRKCGSRATPARLLMLEALAQSKTPVSPQALIEKLDGAMDQATVYRIVAALKRAGLIRQIDLRHNHAHYELARTGEHHHLVCTRCGRIEDVEECEVAATHAAILRRSKHFAEITQHALEFYGICKKCGAAPVQ